MGGALVEYFFGPKGDQKLTLEKFHEFHSQLCMELLEMEVGCKWLFLREVCYILNVKYVICLQ